MALAEDDPVLRVVDRAMAAQMRLMTSYMENMREQIRQEVKRELQAEFCGDRIHVGKGTAERNRQRDAAIWRDSRPVADGGLGLSLRALGRKYHVDKRTVSRALVKGSENKQS